MNSEMKVFISYSKEDKDIAEKIYNDINNSGIKPWMDIKDILPGQERKSVIAQSIKDSSYLIALLSSNSISKKGYLHKEIKIALNIIDELPSPFDVFLIPARIDDCEPKDDKLRNLQWVDLFPSYEEGFKQILRVLKRSKPDEEKYNKKLIMVLSATVKEVDKLRAEAIVNHLRQICGDFSLTIEEILPGSVILVIDCSEKSYKRINNLFKNGKLSKINGITVLGIQYKVQEHEHDHEHEIDIKKLYKAYNPSKPIDLSKSNENHYYIDFSSVRPDIVSKLSEEIKLSDNYSLHFVSGHIGSGKTTELYKIKTELELTNYHVAYVDINSSEYLSMEDSDIIDILFVIMLNVDESLNKYNISAKTTDNLMKYLEIRKRNKY